MDFANDVFFPGGDVVVISCLEATTMDYHINHHRTIQTNHNKGHSKRPPTRLARRDSLT